MITIEKVSKSFGEQPVVKEISLSLEKQKTHVLIGASGCGKSTLLKMIIGLIKPDSGSIRVNIPENLLNARYTSQKIGYVIQDGGLFPHLTAKQNIGLMGKILGMPQDKIDARIDELGWLTSFSRTLLNSWPHELSGGQRQRASLMRALFLDPPILLMDEPLGALDPILRSEIQTELKEIFLKLKKTVVLVTHDLPEASFLGDTVTLLHAGRVEQSSSRDEFFKSPATDYSRKFIDSQRVVF
jgi:osmoprotectant transport system ATP-binding protein